MANLVAGQNALNAQMVPLPVATTLGIRLKNPLHTSTYWFWGVDGVGSSATLIDRVAYPTFPISLPCRLDIVRLLTGRYGDTIDAEWREVYGQGPLIIEYGTYEFDWATKTLTRVG